MNPGLPACEADALPSELHPELMLHSRSQCLVGTFVPWRGEVRSHSGALRVPLSSVDHRSLDPSVGPGQSLAWIHSDLERHLSPPALGDSTLHTPACVVGGVNGSVGRQRKCSRLPPPIPRSSVSPPPPPPAPVKLFPTSGRDSPLVPAAIPSLRVSLGLTPCLFPLCSSSHPTSFPLSGCVGVGEHLTHQRLAEDRKRWAGGDRGPKEEGQRAGGGGGGLCHPTVVGGRARM